MKTPDNPAVWNTLLHHHGSLFSGITVRVASRFGAIRADEISDARQEALLQLSRRAREARIPSGPDEIVEVYLKKVVANSVHDYFRARKALCRSQDQTVPLTELIAGSTAETLDRSLLLKQIESEVGPAPRDRLLFRLYFREGWSAQEISSIASLGLSVKGVETAISRMVQGLRSRLKPKPA